MGKILFIRGGAVGDFILTMPAIQLVREQLPDNDIEVLGYPAITALAVATGLVDRTRSIEDAQLAVFFAPGATLNPEWCAYFASFDVVVSYLYDPDGFFGDNLEKAGVKTLLRGPFRPVDAAPFVPAATQLAAPLEQLALFLDNPEMTLDYGLADLERWTLSSETSYIAIHPGSGSPGKNWSFESWVEVLVELNQSLDVHFLVTSGEAEHEVIDQFIEMLSEKKLPHTHLTGLSLPELGAVFGTVDFYLGHDSGISHLAASAGADGLLLFGPTNPDVWAPVSPGIDRVVSKDESPGGIAVKDVLDALRSWSSSHRSRR
tara:strand:- start:1091 stop:2044 length:954 start_codon:yes stop_codon:yes gene_type:complete